MSKSLDGYVVLEAFVARYPTQKAAAEALQMSQAYLTDLLRRKRGLSASVLARLGLVKVERVTRRTA